MSNGDGATYDLQLNLGNKCGENNGPCNCTRNADFVAKRDDSIPGAIGFTKYTHELTSKDTFTLQTNLGNNQTIRGTLVTDVKEVEVYFWKGNLGKPILLGIKKNKQEETEYYSYSYENPGEGNWSNAGNEGKPLVQLLDDQNCRRNHAVPLEISDPTKNHAPDIKSTCLNTTRKITGPNHSPSPKPPGDEYTVKEYIVRSSSYSQDTGAQISRVTFGGQDTKGIDFKKKYPVSRVRIYSQQGTKDSNPPLMLQCVQKGGQESKWFYSNDSSGRNWNEIVDEEKSERFYSDSLGFYPTDELTTELDNVRCFSNNVVIMDISRGVSGPYCCTYHDKRDKKVTVTPGSVSVLGSQEIPYSKHSISSGDTKLAKIKFSPQWYQDTKIKITSSRQTLPITGPVNVYVFYCNKKNPVLMCVESTGGQVVTGWYQKDKSSNDNQSWIIVSNGPNKSPDNIQNCNEWTKLKDVLQKVCGCDYGTCTELFLGPFLQPGSQTYPFQSIYNPVPDGRASGTPGKDQEGHKLGTDAATPVTDTASDSDTNVVQDKSVAGISSAVKGGPDDRKADSPSSTPTPREPAQNTGVLDSATIVKAAGDAFSEPKDNDLTGPPVAQPADEQTASPVTEEGLTESKGVSTQAAARKASAPSKTPPVSTKTSNEDSTPNIIVSVPAGILSTSALACFAGWKLYNRYNGDPWVR